jgi:ABC-type multidrug transport system permease subunit
MYFQLEKPINQTEIFNRVGCLFFLGVNQFMTTMFPVILTFPEERALFLKESGSRMYGAVPYFFGKTLIEVPLTISTSLCMVAVLYYIVGFNPDFDRLLFMMLAILLITFAAQSLGLFAGCAFTEAKVANAVAPLFVIPFFLLGGFFLNPESFPSYLNWLSYASPFKYTLEALVWNEFEGDYPFVIQRLGFTFGKWESIAVLALIGCILRFLALCFLKALAKNIQ